MLTSRPRTRATALLGRRSRTKAISFGPALLLAASVGLAACGGGADTDERTEDTGGAASLSQEPSPTEDTGEAASPSQDPSPTLVAVPSFFIGDFCAKVDVAAIPALIGGPISDENSGTSKPGELLPGGRKTSSFACFFRAEPVRAPTEDGAGFTQTNRSLSLAVRGAPATATDFDALRQCQGVVDVPVTGLGDLARGSLCTEDGTERDGTESKSLTISALLGDALYFCGLDRPADEMTPALIAQAVEFCSKTPADVA